VSNPRMPAQPPLPICTLAVPAANREVPGNNERPEQHSKPAAYSLEEGVTQSS
jgi:hypothetical protein